VSLSTPPGDASSTPKKLEGHYYVDDGELILKRDNQQFVVSADPAYKDQVTAWLARMAEGNADLSDLDPDLARQLSVVFEEHGFLADASDCQGLSGRDALLDLEDYTNELLYRTFYRNVFWKKIQSAPAEHISNNVIYGFVIENYHFLYRESWFDSPALCYAPSKQVQLLMNEFYGEEYGHDELLLKSLNSIGISRAEIQDTIPLRETLALCNSLAYWASYDPLFFFTTLGVLEGKDVSEDSFLAACDRLGLPASFVQPLRTHSDINLKGGHGCLSREIFKHVPFISSGDLQRMKCQTALFVQLYDAFYAAVWNHYSSVRSLLRRVSEV